ncbi:MFS transporter [Streptomyces sp900116325]|uniref:MFS transporter n=1 Tax=Streptomyces sp. 900116325 TaxID=3154295 RepID=UPI0033A0BEBB
MIQKLTVPLATTSAVTAANVYLNQPLLGAVAASFGVAPDALGTVPTATQLGYAAGILLLVPAGDSRDRRRLILGLGTASALALAACAVSTGVCALIVSSFAVGLLSPVPQLVTPLAVALAGNAGRGRIVGTVQGGLLIGVLASRAYAGGAGRTGRMAGRLRVFRCADPATDARASADAAVRPGRG